jgi:hypothetical protein
VDLDSNRGIQFRARRNRQVRQSTLLRLTACPSPQSGWAKRSQGPGATGRVFHLLSILAHCMSIAARPACPAPREARRRQTPTESQNPISPSAPVCGKGMVGPAPARAGLAHKIGAPSGKRAHNACLSLTWEGTCTWPLPWSRLVSCSKTSVGEIPYCLPETVRTVTISVTAESVPKEAVGPFAKVGCSI